ncbi:hypothetical protein FBU30_009513 [Linnemannia zychae]|nr:hypothetical protein FBU30_009513 [Linnemannia zychae]
MDFTTLLANSSSNNLLNGTHIPAGKENDSIVIINNLGGAGATGCIDNSKNSKYDNNTTATLAAFSVDFDDFNNNTTNDTIGLYTNNYWDQLSADPETLTGLDQTPELSPEMSIYSPAVDSVGSPYTYDPLGFGESSSSVEWHSPIEDPLASLGSFDGDFDVGFPNDALWASQQDFELFPVCQDESAKLKKLLMDTQPEPLTAIKESPHETTLDGFPSVQSDTISPALTTFSSQDIACPTTFSEAKALGQDMQAPNYRVAPRKVVQSPTKVGFQPAKKPRRRRITSEEASRVIPADQMNDPNAKARYKCSECGKTFSRPFNLRSHRDTHTGFRPFECPHKDKAGSKCKWSFARRHDLERHIVSKHTKGKNFQCRTCGVECTRSDAFKRHLARNAECTAGETLEMELDSDQVSHL